MNPFSDLSTRVEYGWPFVVKFEIEDIAIYVLALMRDGTRAFFRCETFFIIFNYF